MLPPKSVAVGEISMTGKIMAINQIGACIKEIEKFSLETVFVAHGQQLKTECKVQAFRNVYDVLRLFPEA